MCKLTIHIQIPAEIEHKASALPQSATSSQWNSPYCQLHLANDIVLS
jgi:hypothetical protein